MASVDIKSAVKNYGDVEVLHGADGRNSRGVDGVKWHQVFFVC